jgi:hypothetical protein
MFTESIRKLELARNRLIPYIQGLTNDIEYFARCIDVNAPAPLSEEADAIQNITDLTLLRDTTAQDLQQIERRIELLRWQDIYQVILEREESCRESLRQKVQEIECKIKNLLEGVRQAAFVDLEKLDETVASTMHEMIDLKTHKNYLLEKLGETEANIAECKQILSEGSVHFEAFAKGDAANAE